MMASLVEIIGVFDSILREIKLHTTLQHIKKQNSKEFEHWNEKSQILKFLEVNTGYCLLL